MTSKKRGLSRGLEALLADVQSKNGTTNVEDRHVVEEVQELRMALKEFMQRSSPSVDRATSNANIAISSNSNLHRERLNLLKEAEALKELIDDIESIIGGSSL